MNKSPQTTQILQYLESGQSLTPLDALRLFGCFRLGGRIYDLRKEGHVIESKMITVGDNKRVAEYRLIQQ